MEVRETPGDHELRHRIAGLEVAVRDARRATALLPYTRFYPVVAGFMVLLSFVSMFELPSDVDPSVREPFPAIWEEAGQPNGEPAALALLLAGVLVVLAIVATFRPGLAGVPIGVAVLAALLVVMLLSPPGFSAEPSLTQVGQAGLVLGGGTVLLGVAHAVHAFSVRRTDG